MWNLMTIRTCDDLELVDIADLGTVTERLATDSGVG